MRPNAPPTPSVKRPGYSECKEKVLVTADAGADGAASLVFIASPCPLLPRG